jgi:hypothetical protein
MVGIASLGAFAYLRLRVNQPPPVHDSDHEASPLNQRAGAREA